MPSAPVLVFDGDCGFCRLWIDRWKALTGDRVEYAPFQTAAHRFPNIPPERFREAVHFIEASGAKPSGAVSSGADAVFRLLTYAPGKGRLHWLYENVPGFAPISESGYRFAAGHRPALYTLTRLLWGAHFERPSHDSTRWLFLRLLALTYLFAFLSLYVQIPGLIGSRGILPAANFLQAISQNLGAERYWAFPTLAWISSSDGALRFLALGGGLLSVVGLIGVFPTPVFALLWVFYSSLVVVGQDFLSFQWDIFLLEAGFLGILFAPRREPSPTVLWLFRLLLFRLMFSSGAIKLASGDPAWHSLTALQYHYETQPLPTPLAWYAQQLPAWFQTFSTVVMFGIELGTPFLIFAPRRLRFLGAGGMIFLQVLIALTGNYAFFNLLTLALCLLLLDDALVGRLLPSRLRGATPRERSRVHRAITATLAPILIFAGGLEIARIFWEPRWIPEPVGQLVGRLSQLHIISNYGLFAVMTTSRLEIIVEGSNDGETWLAYEFKYKPGDLKRRPPIVAPHQPRLDWQMWFAALGNYRGNPWFVNLMVRLLEGSPDVLALLRTNPFPDAPPRYVRAEVYDYHFTDFAGRRATGAWWRRDFKGRYFPVGSLHGQ